MIEKLFGSRTRTRLLLLLSLHTEQPLYIRELSRMLGEQMNAVRRELNNCENLGLVTSVIENRKKYYTIQTHSVMVPLLRQLLVSAQFLLDDQFVPSLQRSGKIDKVILLGFFTQSPDAPVDVCIIGEIGSEAVKKHIDEWDKTFFTHLRFTVMSAEEYRYRASMSDRFLYSIQQVPHLVVFDKAKA